MGGVDGHAFVQASSSVVRCPFAGPRARRRSSRLSRLPRNGQRTTDDVALSFYGPAQYGVKALCSLASVLDALADVVGADALIARPGETRVYECDGWTLAQAGARTSSCCRAPPSRRRRSCASCTGTASPFVPRGAGTGLSGGCLPLDAPVMICTSRLNRIVEIDLANRRAVVEAGVVNLAVTRAVAAHGLLYAPDPSSQSACTIGGNVAENSGGPHTLKYGVTTNHVLGRRAGAARRRGRRARRGDGGRAGLRPARPGGRAARGPSAW